MAEHRCSWCGRPSVDDVCEECADAMAYCAGLDTGTQPQEEAAHE